jgi:hypothetical protein
MPRFSPLWFEDGGSLLVQAPATIVRIDLRTLDAEPVDEEIDPWPLVAIGKDGNRWSGIALPCDHSNVALLLSTRAGAPLPSRPIDLVAPRPGGCGRSRGDNPPLPRPVAWSASGETGLFSGHLFGDPLDGVPSSPGSPRSPDGRYFVSGTGLGLLVTGGSKPALWRTDVSASKLADCVIANRAAAAACILEDRVVLVEPKRAAGSP